MRKACDLARIKSTLFWVPMFLLLTSCARSCTESALSDVVVAEAGLLTLGISMEKDVGDKFSSGDVSVWVRDKNGQALSIMNGGVAVNEVDLSISKSVFGNLPYYFANGNVVELEDGRDHAVEVTLGDGSKYVSSVSLPPVGISQFDAPERHLVGNELTVRWGKINSAYDAILEWEKVIKTDTTNLIESGSIDLANGQTSHRFSTGFFKAGENQMIGLSVRLTAQMKGDIHPTFRSDSFWNIIFTSKRFINIEQAPS